MITLYDLNKFIVQNGHLPNIPSEAEVKQNENKIDIAEFQVKLLEKIEELTLYIIRQQNEIDTLKMQSAKKQ